MCTGVGCQSPLYGDCRQPEKVVKGIYITFCTPPWVHAEMFDSILSNDCMNMVLMYFEHSLCKQSQWLTMNGNAKLWAPRKNVQMQNASRSVMPHMSFLICKQLFSWKYDVTQILVTISLPQWRLCGSHWYRWEMSWDIRDRWLRQALQGRTSLERTWGPLLWEGVY